MGKADNLGLPPLLIAGIISMMLLALTIIIFMVIYQRRVFDQQQEMSNRERKYQRNLLFATIQSQEKERKRIASDLHDSVGALLSATKMYLQGISGDLDLENLNTSKIEAINLVNETLKNVREISHNLLPPNLERFGLVAALEDLFNALDTSSWIDFNFSTQNTRRFEVQREVVVYRIIQELVNNTFKHANAKTISLNLNFNEDKLYVEYTDDGVGFNFKPDKQKARYHGLGMNNLESRVNLLDADLEFITAKGEGVNVKLQLLTETPENNA